VEALLRDDPVILEEWRRATTRDGGRPTKTADNISSLPRRSGTDRAYTLSRLKRERPDLFRRVVKKELSAHAAAIAAGFVKEPTALDQIRKLLPKLTPKERAILKSEL
jgi:hypothetical protein